MTDTIGQFETQDIAGNSKHFEGNVDASLTAIPVVSDKIINEVLIYCPIEQVEQKVLKVSFDGGTTFKILTTGDSLIWTPKGARKQIHIQSDANTSDYKIDINFEDY